jgi:glycosyltransferase involved in cell wall biosynthesis
MLHHVRLMKEEGYRFVALLHERGPLIKALEDEGVSCIVEPFRHYGLRSSLRQPGFIVKIADAFRSRVRFVRRAVAELKRMGRPVVHAQSILCGYAVLAAKWAGCPLIWHVREERKQRLIYTWRRLCLRWLPSHVVLVSHAIARQYRLGRRATVIYNFAEFPDDAVRNPRSRGEKPVVVYVGALSDAKGAPEFVESCANLHSRGVGFKAVMVGDGQADYVARLRETLRVRGLDQVVELRGYEDDMRRVYRAGDILMFPSRTDALPRAVMEAMAYGLAIVATRVGGVPEMLGDGEAGLLVDRGDVAGLTNAVRRLLLDGEFRARTAANARARARRMFSPGAYRTAMNELYARVLAPSRHPA